MKKIIYLDYASAAPVDPRVARMVHEYSLKFPGNPSSLHSLGISAKKVLEDSRRAVASVLHARVGEVIFTGSGTESNNIAIVGTSPPLRTSGQHIITTSIEHPSVLNVCQALERYGFSVTYLPVGANGIIDPRDLAKSLRKDTILVSLMYANNEVGTIQPIFQCSSIIRKHRKKYRQKFPYFHSDACQASSYLEMNPVKLGVDMLTLNSAKIGGPRGVGCLYMKRGVPFEEVIIGGGQEFGKRSGTENIPGIAGFAFALKQAEKYRVKGSKKMATLRDLCMSELTVRFPSIRINGDRTKRLPNNLHITFPGIDAEALVLYLDQQGVCVGSGSACSSGSIYGSHVLLAMGISKKHALQSIRITLGPSTTKEEIVYFVNALEKVVKKLNMTL